MVSYKVLGWAIALALVVVTVLLFTRAGRTCLAWGVGIASALGLAVGFLLAMSRFVSWVAAG